MSETAAAPKKFSLPIKKDPVQAEAPQAEKTAEQALAEKARAERQASISVAAKKTATKAEAPPPFVANADRIKELDAYLDENGPDAFVKLAEQEAGLRGVDSSDRRVFQYTGATKDARQGQDLSRSKIRTTIVEFLKRHTGDRAITINGSKVELAQEARVIHAYMMMAGPTVFPGQYDSGYIATRRGENKTRGMVARGYLNQIGDLSAPQVVQPALQESAPEAEAPTAEEAESA